jgi:nucleoid-associated protein YgaU
MVTSVVAGVVPVLAGALAQPLAGLAASAVETPNELKQLAIEHVVAPFLDAGSSKLGDALVGALVHSAGLDPPTTPSETAIKQVRIVLQLNLKNKLAAMPAVKAAAGKTHLTTNQLAAKLAQAIAQRLAGNLAHGLVRVKSPARLNNGVATTTAERVTQVQWSQQPSTPPSAGSYTVKLGDSLWRISQGLLGPNATTGEINQTWRAIYHDNHVTVGADPNRIVPGQELRIPHPVQSGFSREWVLLPWLVVLPGILTGFAARRRRRAHRAASQRSTKQADVAAHATKPAEDDDSRLM